MKHRAILSFLLLLLTALTMAAGGSAGPYKIEVVTDPAVVPIGRATLRLKVSDSAGQPVADADVRTLTGMPGMFMGEREQQAIPVPGEPGAYTSPAQFPMAGAYEVKVTVNGPDGEGIARIAMEPGDNTAATTGGGFPWSTVFITLAALALFAFVLVRVIKTGQRVDASSIFNRQVLFALLVLGAAVWISVYAVNNFRRKGAMTPIEAQVMEMNIPPPEGTTPVELITAEQKPLQATVTYTGQAVGFIEQDIFPRVQGVIEWMPLYAGDKVQKGQVLARLDTSQLDPEVAEKGAGVTTAAEGVGVATLEFQQALAEVSEAQAEATMARAGVEEARSMLEATQEGRNTAKAMLDSAQAEVRSAEAEVAAAQADADYWRAEIARMKTLLDQGAVSKQEYQESKAEADKAEADLRRAKEMVTRAQAEVASARAEQKKVEAEVSAANRRVAQAEAQARSREARVKTAKSGAEAAKGRISQARAGVQEARAGLEGAAAMQGYATIRAEIHGVVTERLISPGVLVSPGQAILRIAQIEPIRVQANVPESDLGDIKVGSPVRIIPRGGGDPISARVSSVAPAVDPGSRTALVEAILENASRSILPGQFVTMEIAVGGRSVSSVVIPESAVQRSVEPGEGVSSTETSAWVWIAEPIAGQSGRFTAARKQIELGSRAGDQVAVTSGLNPGDRVIAKGAAGLKAGQVVTNAADLGSVARTVEVLDAGYEPSTIQIEAGKPTTITFIRRSESTCGEVLKIPSLKLSEELPLNQAVAVEIPAQSEGEIKFTCGMDMMEGKVLVR
jgi:RND family efflux transporter MFP subunit